ncbi:MAG: hypothetical protein NTZ84_01135 [Candidatus Nealsonbacteria bacterium]|nr:hypothetical protein [Candidatus Nealsonbacteria bacterium]
MTKYKEEEILRLIVRLLNKSISSVGYPPYNYENLLNMEPKEALKELSSRLRRIRDINKGAKRGFSFYFSTDMEYMIFLIESALVECLNVFFILKKEKEQIPTLYDEHDLYGIDKEFSPIIMGKMTPFRRWLKDCQNKKTKSIRTVAK